MNRTKVLELEEPPLLVTPPIYFKTNIDVRRALISFNNFNATLFDLDILIKQSLRIFFSFACVKYFNEVKEEQAIYFGGFKK